MSQVCEGKISARQGVGGSAAGGRVGIDGAVRARLALAYHKRAPGVNPPTEILRFANRAGEEAGGIPLRLPDGRVAGAVVGDVLTRYAKGSLHRLQRPPAWAFNESLLRQAEALGARTVEIHDLETGITYRAPLSRFWTRGVKVSRGFGDQLALVMSDWQTGDAPAADAVQLALPLEEVER